MKKVVLIIVLSVFLFACNLPFSIAENTPTSAPVADTPVIVAPTLTSIPPATATVEPTITSTVPAATDYDLAGVLNKVPGCLPVTPAVTIVPAQPYDPNNGPMEYFPLHRKISFPGYPLSGKFFEPVIRIYPVADYVAMNAVISDQVTALNTLLTSKPALPAGDIPLLPVFNAAQIFRANIGYLPFQNGQGVRFLTEYAQYSAPVNNTDLFYTYQGITADGKYWISAIFPINAAYLQEAYNSTVVPADGIPFPAWDSPTFESDLQTYYTAMTNRLGNTAASSFIPALDCLDAYIQSFQIND